MSTDWEVGDLALYVGRTGMGDPRFHQCAPSVPRPNRGSIYTVESVVYHFAHGADWIALGIDGPKSDWRDGEWNALSFVKVTPPKADAFDLETINLMNPKPVEAVR